VRIKKAFYAGTLFFAVPYIGFAWGGPEHCSITAAALSALSPAVLAFLGAEAARLIKIYCNYPDFNWAVYGTCSKTKNGIARIPDTRRDFEAPYYCDWDEFTGQGLYFGHGPEIGKELPAPDEHAGYMYERHDFSSSSVKKFILRTCAAFESGNYFEAIRFAGVVIHYMEDSTPPPHTLAIPGGSNPFHHDMEAINNHSAINIRGYAPGVMAASPNELSKTAAIMSDTIALKAQAIAKETLALLEKGKKREAEDNTVECANIAARATADLINTLFEMYKDKLPARPVSRPGVNLLFNPSFDIDTDGDHLPDGWIREWHDLNCPYDMHLWDRVSTRGKGACVRLYNTPAAGASWRAARTRALPVQPGGTYELTGLIRPQGSSGENYMALRFQDAEYGILSEMNSEKLSSPCTWRKISVKGTAPENAVDVLAACVSKANSGSVLFDKLELRIVT